MKKLVETTKDVSFRFLLDTNRWFKIGEIVLIFTLAIICVIVIKPLVGENPIMQQGVVWVANVFMLVFVWVGLKIRGKDWGNFGLTFKSTSVRSAMKTLLLSLLVFALAVTGFVLGSILMANITGIPEDADMSGYNYLKNNIVMLILSLAGVYVVSSFGEEVIYRAFLINRLSEIGLNKIGGQFIPVVISSIIFGLVHYEWGSMGIVQTGFMGLVLGICYIKLKKRLWVLILAHAYMDTILIVQMYFGGK